MGKRPQPEIRKGLLGSDIGLQELIDGLCPLYAVFPRALWPCWPCSWRGRSTSRHPCQQDLGGSGALLLVQSAGPLPLISLEAPLFMSSQSQGQKGWAGVSLRQEASLDTPQEKSHQRLLAFPICSQRKGNGRKFYPPRV